jgi:hypothetical protein
MKVRFKSRGKWVSFTARPAKAKRAAAKRSCARKGRGKCIISFKTRHGTVKFCGRK